MMKAFCHVCRTSKTDLFMAKRVSLIMVRLTILILVAGILLDSEAHSKSLEAAGDYLGQKTLNLNQNAWNVVFILTDDQRWDTLCGVSGELENICAEPPENHPMPTVEEELMAKGIVFTNTFATTPICCPSRAGFLSGGFYAHHTNVLTNNLPNGGATRFGDEVTLATVLQKHGYKTAIVGKYLNGYGKLIDLHNEVYIPPGWDYFAVRFGEVNGENVGTDPYKFAIGSSSFDTPGTGTTDIVNNGTYLTDYERDKALQFIDKYHTSPFFLFLSTSYPHRPAIPAPRHEGLFSNFEYRDRAWGEQPDGDVSDKPWYVQRDAQNWIPNEDDEFHRNQLRALRAIDEAVAAIIDSLGQKGLLERTVFIFSSDNGLLWGEHKLIDKIKPYEESIRVPLIIRIPTVEHRLAEQLVTIDLDIAPTILQLAGITVASDGMSILPLIEDPTIEWRHELLLQGFNEDLMPTWAAIRTDDNWKYVEYITGEKELYNLKEDPYELTSKHIEPEYAAQMTDLAARLQQLDRGIAIKTENLPNPQVKRFPGGILGQPYDFQLSAWGGNGDYHWSVYTEEPCLGGLPKELILTDEGRLTGTPSRSEIWTFCIKVEDTSPSPQPGNARSQSYISQFSLEVMRPKVFHNYLSLVFKNSSALTPSVGVSSFTTADPVPNHR